MLTICSKPASSLCPEFHAISVCDRIDPNAIWLIFVPCGATNGITFLDKAAFEMAAPATPYNVIPPQTHRCTIHNIADDLLFAFTSEELVAALESTALRESQLDSAARCLADWYFQRERPRDIQKFPQPIKTKLLEHIHRRGNPEWEQYSGVFQ